VWNGDKYPIDVLARSWDEWVGWNSWRGARDDFNRRFIFSLALARDNPLHWLFGGVFEVLGRHPTPHSFSYDVELRSDLMGAFVKRLEVAFRMPGRAVRLNLEKHLDRIEVVSILPQPYAGEPFPGHDQINHTLGELEVVVSQQRPDWRGALQHMKGVYVIHDQVTGKPYVGSAYGDTGIWARLGEYVATLHGGNLALRELVECQGRDYARANLRFALLEFWSIRTSDEQGRTDEITVWTGDSPAAIKAAEGGIGFLANADPQWFIEGPDFILTYSVQFTGTSHPLTPLIPLPTVARETGGKAA
jgi:hypothetical protein